jgi:hypothetical protein
MLLKIYLGISISSFVLLKLAGWNMAHIVKMKFKDKLNKEKKSDKIGLMFNYIKMLILCFIPIYNIIMFIMAFQFFMNVDKLIEKSNIEEVIAQSEKHE